ncbi:MAG: hypothetical protein E7481_03295 [Ruminococcaceae bacterium]|nr:hypothetical protein [Oscillospiraceae bacterium]
MRKILVIFILILLLTACANTEKPINIDANKVGNELDITNNSKENIEHETDEIDKVITDDTNDISTNDSNSSLDNKDEKKALNLNEVNGVPHIRRLMSANPYTIDSGCPTNDLRKMYALSDIVFTAKVESYAPERFDSTLYSDVEYVPMTVEITNIIKGADTATYTTTADNSTYFEFGYSGAPMSLTQYKEFVNPDFDITLYPENTIVDCSFAGQDLPKAETEYLFFIKEFEDHIQSEVTPEMRFAILGNNEGIYEIESGVVKRGVNEYGEIEEVLSNLQNEDWLTYVYKPDWSLDIPYMPEGFEQTMLNSEGSDYAYRMYYEKEPDNEYPNGAAFSVWQTYGEKQFTDFYKSFDGQYFEINGVEIFYFSLDIGRNDMAIVFNIGEVEVAIEAVYPNDKTELINIAQHIINASSDK